MPSPASPSPNRGRKSAPEADSRPRDGATCSLGTPSRSSLLFPSSAAAHPGKSSAHRLENSLKMIPFPCRNTGYSFPAHAPGSPREAPLRPPRQPNPSGTPLPSSWHPGAFSRISCGLSRSPRFHPESAPASAPSPSPDRSLPHPPARSIAGSLGRRYGSNRPRRPTARSGTAPPPSAGKCQ